MMISHPRRICNFLIQLFCFYLLPDFRFLGHAEEGQLWNLYTLRAKFAEQDWVSDAQTSLCVGEIVCLRLRSSELVESQVIHVHEGKEERVDVQLQTPGANGKFLTFKGYLTQEIDMSSTPLL